MSEFVIPGNTKQKKINNYLYVIEKQIQILDKLMDDFCKIIQSRKSVKTVSFSPYLQITELQSGNEIHEIHLQDNSKIVYDEELF